MHNYGVVLAHSAKGSEWENHKYIRKKNGTYYYLDENGHETTTTHKDRSSKSDTTSTDKKDEKTSTDKKEDDKNVSAEAKKLIDSNIKAEDLTAENIEKLAKEVIRGGFGNGQERKDLLGEHYATIQKRVNELMKGYAATATTKKEDSKETKTTKKKSTKKKTSTKDKKKTLEADVVKHDGLYDCGSYLVHFGNKNSGRYPRGSGERPHQHDGLGSKGRDVRPYEADSYNPKKIGFHKKSEEQKSYSRQRRNEMADTLLDQNIKGGKDRPNISAAEKAFKDADRTIDSTKRIKSDIDDIKKRKRYLKEAEKMSKMSDEELKAVVNRAKLEKEYLNAVDYSTLDDGNRKIDDVLNITGDVVSIAGGIVTIAAAVHYIRKGLPK